MRHIVPAMKLIPQQKNMACWYASAQMLIQWKREQSRATFAAHPDPSEIPRTKVWEVSNNGITNPQVVKLATTLGLKQVPPMSPLPEFLRQLLVRHGPLWTNGTSHIVVIAGIDTTTQKFLVYDPWPVGKGKIEWRDFSWYYTGKAASSRDTSAQVQTVFLYHP